MEGKPFSLEEYTPFVTIYNSPAKAIVLLCGRQVGKSVSLCNFLLTEGLAIPQFRSLFVAPSKEQTSRFSNTRFAKALFFSPLIKKNFVTNDMPANNVMLRMLANGSEFFFTYAQDDAERVRGISSDRICFDECQSIILEAVEPVIRECMAASDYKLRTYCGTPLSAENDIEVMLWQKSTQNEWVVPCIHCRVNNILGIQNLGPKFLWCAKCHKELDVRLGSWFASKPQESMSGYHIPQIAIHRNVSREDNYQSILDKRKDYSAAQFNNEVLGISDAQGARLISIDQVKSLCKSYTWVPDKVNQNLMQGVSHVVAGVDWGGQSPTNVSRSALCIWGILRDGRLRMLYGKIYPSGHPVQDLVDIAKTCQLYNVQALVGDDGEGMLANAQLRQMLGFKKVFGNRYSSNNARIVWNDNQNAPGYVSDRTMLIDQIMHGIITGFFDFPHYDFFKPFSEDIMALYEETTPQGKRVWRHAATRPDDFAHAMVLGWLASKIVMGTVVMYQDPVKKH